MRWRELSASRYLVKSSLPLAALVLELADLSFPQHLNSTKEQTLPPLLLAKKTDTPMPRLVLDPNDLLCPDYTLPIYENARATFVNDNTMHKQAADILTKVWKAKNAVDIQ